MKINWEIKQPANQQQERVFGFLEEVPERLLLSRGIDSPQKLEEFLNPDYDENLHDPFLMDGMEAAVKTVLNAAKSSQTICVFGDYDADGVTASALLKDFFDSQGIKNFCYIPERNKEGYGMNKEAIDYIKKNNASLIVTVDCGVSNFDEARYAKSMGLSLVILDHHHVPEKLPEADAIINPKKPNCPYPEKNLAGVGVAFKFIQALSTKYAGFDSSQLKWLLDLVAIGTIADCVPLVGENRILVKYGLIVLSKTKRVGLRQLFQVGRINIDENNLPSSQQVAFQVAPRINAAGRMDHANTAYQLMIMSPRNESQARVLALELEAQNQKRQKVTGLIIGEIEKKIAASTKLPKIIIQTSPHWEVGIIGLAAGKITDRFHRPTLLFQQQNGQLKGSGRSIPDFNLIEALERNSKFLTRYGGHSQAAGMTLNQENFADFCQAIQADAEKELGDELVKKINIDLKIKLSQINQKMAVEISALEPFGQQNSQPIFISSNLQVIDQRKVGNGEKHLKLWVKEDSNDTAALEAIGFGFAKDVAEISVGDRVDLVYQIEQDNWNGHSKIQLKIVDLDILSK